MYKIYYIFLFYHILMFSVLKVRVGCFENELYLRMAFKSLPTVASRGQGTLSNFGCNLKPDISLPWKCPTPRKGFFSECV